ncbi:MAG TPA: carboxypeptidase-like regulatory domain-containing protein [Aridibacter sp.]|nr:carboxypeptidase-like regulatory domain-containing protein [Aridibacter sp.]
MINKFVEGSRFLMAALLLNALLFSTAFGQVKSGTSDDTAKKQLSEIPMLVSLSSTAKVGERIRFVGAQFEPGETVTITISSVDLETGLRAPVENDATYADSKGNFVFEMVMPGYGRYIVTATGSISKTEASRIVSSNLQTPLPITLPGINASCADLNASTNEAFSHITSDWGFKIDGQPNGTFAFVNSAGPPVTELTGGAPSDPGNSVTVSSTSSQITEWSSTRPITAVIVKTGGGSYAYPYDPASMGPDGPLVDPDPQGISHVEFCFQPFAKIIIVKHASPPSIFQFGFTTTGLGGATFSLTDDDPDSDPMEMFVTSPGNKTVTETDPSPFTLTSIDCVSENGTSTINSESPPTADVDLADGDTVTCTFNNDFLTAAEAVVQGRVTDPSGRPLMGAVVSATDGSGNLRTARTNMFGFYTIGELEAGTSLLLDVRHKGFIFGSQFVQMNDEVVNVNFTGLNR